jgi:hypothetical protein
MKCEDPENTEGGTEPANEGDIKMEYSYDWMYSPSIRSCKKNLPL